MIRIELPEQLERDLRTSVPDLESMGKTALLVELYRRGVLSHGRLAECLNTSRDRVDALLAKHGVQDDLPTLDAIEKQAETVERLLAQ